MEMGIGRWDIFQKSGAETESSRISIGRERERERERDGHGARIIDDATKPVQKRGVRRQSEFALPSMLLRKCWQHFLQI